jgi:DNA-binding LacI/PurR family transcriptional regulator
MSSEQSGHAAVEALMTSRTRFDAIFAASDLIAIGAIRSLREQGLRVPADVLVAGFDDILFGGFFDPPLTTVHQDTNSAAELLVEALLSLIRGEPVHNQVIPARLILRKSTER